MSEINFNESINNEDIDIAKNKEQLEYGIKLIIDAYENKGVIYENDIKILLEENEQKDMKIRELMGVLEELTKERDFYKNNYEKQNQDNRSILNIPRKVNRNKIQANINLYDSSIENEIAENVKTRVNDINEERNNKNELKLSRNIQHEK
jgi:hypothetical protein